MPLAERFLVAGLLAGLLGAPAVADLATPTPEALRRWVRAGRLDDAEPALEAALAGEAPGWLVAADSLVELALRRDRPWLTRGRWLKPPPVGLAPVSRRDLVVLELDLALRRDDALERLVARRPSTWDAEFSRVLALGERYLPRGLRRDQLVTWVRELGGPGRAGPELVEALGGVLEETGELNRAGAVYRRALQARDPSASWDPWAPLAEGPEGSPLAARLRRTHTTSRARAQLRQELQPDENLGWASALRGWLRLAWALHATGSPEEATRALEEARRRLPPQRWRPRLRLAGAGLRLGHPSLAQDLYRECLSLPAGPGDQAVQTRQGRGRVLALVAAATWLQGDPTEAARTLALAASDGAQVEDVAALFLDRASDRRSHEALADLGELPASLGLGLVAARSLGILHRHARALQVLQETLKEAPPGIAIDALELLWSSRSSELVATALVDSPLAREAPRQALERLTRLPPGGLARTDSGLAAVSAAARWAATLPLPWSPELEDGVVDAVLTWRHQLPPASLAQLQEGLSPAARDLLSWTESPEPPSVVAQDWVARRPPLPVLRRSLDLAVGRSWQGWGQGLVDAIVAREVDAGILAAAHRAAGELASRRGEQLGVLLAGLQALEASPDEAATMDLLARHLEVQASHRRVLQAWAAHVENDHRFAVALRDLWAHTGRPRRALGPLLRARQAAPRDGSIAAATGRLLLDENRDEEALSHLLAAARLRHFGHDPTYAAPLARALARAGHPERARKLYRHWLRQAPDGPARQELEALGPEIGLGDLARQSGRSWSQERGD